MNMNAIRAVLTNNVLLLCEDTPIAQREALAKEFVETVLSMLAFHREYAVAGTRAGNHEIFVHPNDATLPDHWGEKPFGRIVWVEEPGDRAAGIQSRSYWAFAENEHQKGTLLADLRELKADAQTLYDAMHAIDAYKAEHLHVAPAVIDRIAGAFGVQHRG